MDQVRLSPSLQRAARLLTLGLMGGLSFLMGHTRAAVETHPAASGQALTEAWALAQQAQHFDEARRPAAALAAWQRAYDLSSDPMLLLEIGRLERDSGNFARSAHAFQQLLARSEDHVPVARRQLAARQLQAVLGHTAALNVQTNVVDAMVELEPERGVSASSGFVVNLLVDAGERRLSFGKPGYDTRSLVVTLEPGEVRALRIDLDKAAGGRSESFSTQPRWTRFEAPSTSTAL